MEKIILDRKTINLDSLSIRKLKHILNQVEEEEVTIKQEVNNILEDLV